MPKGVYPRSPKVEAPTIESPASAPVVTRNGEVRKVAVAELPNRQSANANVEALRQTHGLDDGESTTARLFGDIAERDRLDETDPNRTAEVLQTPIPVAQNPDEAQEEKFNREPSPAPKPSEEAKPEQTETPAAEKTSNDDFLDWEKLSGKKIRQKVDGKEVIVTAEDLKKYSDQDQIKKHLADEANKVGDERRKLAEERRQLQELRQQRAPQYEAPINGQPQGSAPAPQFDGRMPSDPLFQRIEFLEAQLRNLTPAIQPVIYQSNRQRVSDELKAQGFDDFMDYIPKMEVHMGSIRDPQLAAFYDTTEGSKDLYFRLKAQDMRSRPAPAPARTVQPVPSVSNPVPPATQIDGGSPASGSFTDDAGHNYRAAFRRAQASGDNKEAWNEVLRQKGILPQI